MTSSVFQDLTDAADAAETAIQKALAEAVVAGDRSDPRVAERIWQLHEACEAAAFNLGYRGQTHDDGPQ